jgi:putative hydrolase of the HAD superfamily
MTARRAVFFDFADTLFSSRSLRDAHLRQLRFVGDAIGVDASDDELRASYRRGVGVAYRSLASQPFYLHRDLFGGSFVAMAQDLGGALDDDQVQEVVDRQYAATIATAELRTDCLDSLGRLRDLGLHVQIVSNIDEEQLDGLVRELGLETAVDAATSSEAARSCKPDPGIYEFALRRAGCAPAEVLFVGDTPAHDIVGPQSAGMATALLVTDGRSTPTDCAPDHVIEQLAQVVEIVEPEHVR